MQQKLLPESKQCPTEGWKDSLQRESSLWGIHSKGKMTPVSALLKSSSSFCPLRANICSSNERGPVHELGLPFPADLIRHPQTDSVLVALEKLDYVALMQMSLSETGLKCSFPVFLLFTPLDQWQSFLPFPALLPVRGLNVVPGTANYHFGFLHWPHLGLREGGVTYPSAQQETGRQLQEHWGCSMDLAWQRLQEGTQLLLLCLLYTLKKKKNKSHHHTPAPPPQTHWTHGQNLHHQPHRRQSDK